MKELKINLGTQSFSLNENDFVKGQPITAEGKEVNMAMTVDPSAEYATNSEEYFRKLLIGSEFSRGKFRQLLNIKDLVKLGGVDMTSVNVKAGTTAYAPDNSTAEQKEYRVKPLMVGTEINISELEVAFMSDQLQRGSNNFTDKFAFMNFFYEELERRIRQQLEVITWRGTVVANGVDGLEILMAADADVLKPTAGNGGIASAVTDVNVIAKLKQARNVITGVNDGAVIDAEDFVYIVSKNVYDALADAVSDNKASGLYYLEGETLAFQGKPIYKARGASNDVIIATYWNNLLNIQDLVSDEVGFNIVDFMKTTLTRKVGVRVDFKFQPHYANAGEIYFHKFV